MVQFPEQFRLGTATAAYQIEGAVAEDGRGETIWDRFCATSGKVHNNESGGVACDHYHRYREDAQLMRELGLNAYRFSIAWSRILPSGKGKVNTLGLDFYDRLVDALLAADIEPFVTLYHFDLPQALQDEIGGWTSRETAYAYADYVDIVSRHLGDGVHHWITLNEPLVDAFGGYEAGNWPPDLENTRLAWQASHHLLLAHGLAVPVLRANGGPQTRVGTTLVLVPVHPATTSTEDQQAAQFVDGQTNRWFLDPVFRGHYPADMLMQLGDLAPKTEPGDAEIIARPLDFLGLNYYYREVIHHSLNGKLGNFEKVHQEGLEYTEMDWEVYPAGLREVLLRLHQEYQVPEIYITENGMSLLNMIARMDRYMTRDG